MADLGSIVIDILTGAAGEYLGGELGNLRRILADRFKGSDIYTAFASNTDSVRAGRALSNAIDEAADRDPVFAKTLSEALYALTATGTGSVNVGGNQILGNVGSNSPTVTAGGGARVHIGNRSYPLGGVIGGALVALAIVALILYGGVRVVNSVVDNVSTTSLTATSTCQEFMASAVDVRDEAVRRIATELHQRLGTFDRLNVEYNCGQAPSEPLGDAIKGALPDA